MTSKNLAAPHQAENPTPAKFKIILVACCMLFICFNEQSGIYCPEKTLLKPNLTGPGLLMWTNNGAGMEQNYCFQQSSWRTACPYHSNCGISRDSGVVTSGVKVTQAQETFNLKTVKRWHNFRLGTPHSNFTLGTPHSTSHSTLHTLHFTLRTLHYTLHSARFTLDFTLHTLHFTLCTPQSTHYALHSALCTWHWALYYTFGIRYTVHRTPHVPHSTLYTPHLTLYTPHFTFDTPHFTLHTLHFVIHCTYLRFTFCTSHFAPDNPLSTLYSLHFGTLHPTLYTLHSALYVALCTSRITL